MDEKDIQQLYDQPYAESYDAKFLTSVIDKLNTEHELSLLRGFLRPGMRWLDVACGTGFYLSHFEEIERHGLDLSPAMLSVARRRNPAVAFTEGNFLDSHAAWHDRWDLVSCMWYAYGFVNDMAAVEKLIRNLADWTAPTGSCFLPLADPRLISGAQLPYEVDHPQGKIRIDGILWSFIEDEGSKQHTFQLAPNVELMIEFFDRYFADVRVEIYPQPPRRLPGLGVTRWTRAHRSRKAIVASAKR